MAPSHTKPAIRSTTALKTYTITDPNTFKSTHWNITSDDASNLSPELFTTSTHKMLKPPTISLHNTSDAGPIIAACRLHGWSTNIDICLGDPSSPSTSYSTLDSQSWSGKAFRFTDPRTDRGYVWKRTRDPALGSSRWSSRSFKLVAEGTNPLSKDWEGGSSDGESGEGSGYGDEVVAVFVYANKCWKKDGLRPVGKMEVFDSVLAEDEDLQMLALVAMVGMQTQLTRQENAAAAS